MGWNEKRNTKLFKVCIVFKRSNYLLTLLYAAKNTFYLKTMTEEMCNNGNSLNLNENAKR